MASLRNSTMSKGLFKKQPQQVAPEKSGSDLEAVIRAARAEGNAYIDALAQKIKARDAEGLPIGVIRQMLDKGSSCACGVALQLMKDKTYG